MADNSSAAKRHRQSEKRRIRNRVIRSRVHSGIRKFKDYVESKDYEQAGEEFRAVMKLIDSASGKGVYHKNTAARKKSRLNKMLNSIKE